MKLSFSLHRPDNTFINVIIYYRGSNGSHGIWAVNFKSSTSIYGGRKCKKVFFYKATLYFLARTRWKNINRIDRNLIHIKNIAIFFQNGYDNCRDKIYSTSCMMFFNYYLYPRKTIRCFTKETRAVNAVTFYV